MIAHALTASNACPKVAREKLFSRSCFTALYRRTNAEIELARPKSILRMAAYSVTMDSAENSR